MRSAVTIEAEEFDTLFEMLLLGLVSHGQTMRVGNAQDIRELCGEEVPEVERVLSIVEPSHDIERQADLLWGLWLKRPCAAGESAPAEAPTTSTEESPVNATVQRDSARREVLVILRSPIAGMSTQVALAPTNASALGQALMQQSADLLREIELATPDGLRHDLAEAKS